jgi:mRNA interferase RelE/StbE
MTESKRRWEIQQARNVERVLQRLPRNLFERIDRAILALAEDPWPPGCKKLRGMGYDNHWRIAVGGWRISYAVENAELIILIIEVAPRGDAYRF